MVLAQGYVNKQVEQKRESRNRFIDPHIRKLNFTEVTLYRSMGKG